MNPPEHMMYTYTCKADLFVLFRFARICAVDLLSNKRHKKPRDLCVCAHERMRLYIPMSRTENKRNLESLKYIII